MSRRRVAVTGLGIVSPVGSTIATAWENLKAGRSGIRKVTEFDTEGFSSKIAGTVIDFNADDHITPKEQKKMDVFIQYGLVASREAIADAGLDLTDEQKQRTGVAIGSGIGGLPLIESNYGTFLEKGARRISPFFVPSTIINMVSGNLSIEQGFQGPNISIVSACTTGAHNIGMAAQQIMYGQADVMIAGGAEMTVCPLGIGGFAAARALSTQFNDEPERASRPWDANRDGFVLGAGAGILVLEEYEAAAARGADIYCELAGFGMNGDAYHMTSPSEGGIGASRCMEIALRDAEIDPSAVRYINAHGTSTPAGDKAETEAIKRLFGDAAHQVPISSNKSMIGHLLGASGGVEAIFTALAVRDGVLPPTINYETPDPECDLDYVPNTARDADVPIAISNSFGFGGTNGTLVFRGV